MGPRFDVDKVEKRKFLTLPGLELRPFRRPAPWPIATRTTLSLLVFENRVLKKIFGMKREQIILEVA
jgi:hypothetical protein